MQKLIQQLIVRHPHNLEGHAPLEMGNIDGVRVRHPHNLEGHAPEFSYPDERTRKLK